MAPVLVQSASATGTSGTALTVTLGSSSTAGNCLVACVGTVDATTNPQVSGITLGGSAGNWTAAVTAHNDSFVDGAIWVDRNCAGSQTSVVFSFTGTSGGSPQAAAWVTEWSGVAAASAVDKTNGAVNTGSSWSSGSTGTLAQASEAAIGLAFTSSTVSLTTPGSPWTELSQLNTATSRKFGAAWQVVAATSALTYSGTTGSSTSYATCICTLAAAGSPSAQTGLLASAWP